jgi:FMN reductase
VLILGIGGTSRPGSSSEKVLVQALEVVGAMGCETAILSGESLDLPMYGTDRSRITGKTRSLVRLMRRCDGLLISSPAYHGSVSGMIKNALDYAEELREDDRPYLDGRAVGCFAVANGWQGANATLTSLRAIVHALRGWPTPLGAAINTNTNAFAADKLADDALHLQISAIASQVVDFASSACGKGNAVKAAYQPKLARSRA